MVRYCITVLLYNNSGSIAGNMHTSLTFRFPLEKKIEMQFSFMTLHARIVVNVNRST